MGAGLALGFTIPLSAHAADPVSTAGLASKAPAQELGAWVLVQPDDRVVVRIARTEMGQGTLTGLAQLVAEEMDADWSKVSTELVSPQANWARKNAWGQMLTVGSFGIRFSQDYVRRGGAAARQMLMAAAAQRWGVPQQELTCAQGVVRHPGSQRRATFGQLAQAAAQLPAPDPKSLTLKSPEQWTLIGKPLKRLDTLPKLNGSKVFGVDVQLPGMLNAAAVSHNALTRFLRSDPDRGKKVMQANPSFVFFREHNVGDPVGAVGAMGIAATDTIAMSPPLVIEKAQIDEIIDIAGKAIKEAA